MKADRNNVSNEIEKKNNRSDFAPDSSEPKTQDALHIELYATIAMIAGLTYLLLYFAEGSYGMTEHAKDVFVAAFIRWAKKGGIVRKLCALAAIFVLLVYYHSIGKKKAVVRKEIYGNGSV